MRRPRIVLGLGLGAALAMGAVAHHTARTTLPAATRRALARLVGVDEAAVSMGAVRLGWGGLVIEDLAAGPIAARTVRYTPSLRALASHRVGGSVVLDRVLVEDPPVPLGGLVEIDHAAIDHVELTLEPGRARVRAHGVTVALAAPVQGVPARLDDVSLELDRGPGSRGRLAFTGLTVGPFAGLAGRGRAEAGELEISAAAPGLALRLQASAAEASARFDLDHWAYRWDSATAPFLERLGLRRGELVAGGHVEARRRPAGVHVDAAFEAQRGEVVLPRLAPDALELDGWSLNLSMDLDSDAPARFTSRLEKGEAALVAEARLDGEGPDRTLSVSGTLPRTSCSGLLLSTPPALRRALDGMALEGEIAAHLDLSLPLAEPARLGLDGDVELGCRVIEEPPLADAGRFRTEAPTIAGTDANGRPRSLVLGAASPSFVHLARIPVRLIDAFIEAEDGRFWHHAGLDLAQIRRALAHDLETGAPGRGGSTITQQLAKNLFLSGERTFGRKLEESVLAWRLERRLGKRRILELYLNLVELGPGVYGVAEGAKHWFKKDLDGLSLDEIAQLAALLPAPRRGMDAAFEKRLALLRARLPGLKPDRFASAQP